MMAKVKPVTFVILASVSLCACSTVQMPDIDVPGIPEFKQAAAQLVNGYPEVSQAPVRPQDLRSSQDWDAAAKALMQRRSTFVVPEKGDMPETPEAIEREIDALRAEVRAYKLDDPQ